MFSFSMRAFKSLRWALFCSCTLVALFSVGNVKNAISFTSKKGENILTNERFCELTCVVDQIPFLTVSKYKWNEIFMHDIPC